MIDAIIVDEKDNVATTIHDIDGGHDTITNRTDVIHVAYPVPRGFKIARSPIAKGEHVIKYGVSVGVALSAIQRGDMVHVHNMGNLLTEWRWDA